MKKSTQIKRFFRRKRARKKIGKGTAKKPRLSVFRSNRNVYVQIIDDEKGVTLFSVLSSSIVKNKKKTKTEEAFEAGKIVAEEAVKAGIEEAVFDKGHYDYHGRVKAVAEGAREAGLKI